MGGYVSFKSGRPDGRSCARPGRMPRARLARALAAYRESTHPMNKRQLIDAVRQLNHTAQPDFLAQFDEEALQQYLEHLSTAQEKRLKVAGWVKSIPRPKFKLVS